VAQFLGDIAFLLELGFVAAGLVLIHFGRERSARLVRAAGWTPAVGGGITALCTSCFWFDYHAAGEFDHIPAALRLEASPVSWPVWLDTGSIAA
jgi:hypothetical protein